MHYLSSNKILCDNLVSTVFAFEVRERNPLFVLGVLWIIGCQEPITHNP